MAKAKGLAAGQAGSVLELSRTISDGLGAKCLGSGILGTITPRLLSHFLNLLTSLMSNIRRSYCRAINGSVFCATTDVSIPR